MEPGELVAGRYRLVSLVGRGAMGVVWLARDERLDREVAVKQLRLEGSPDEQAAGDVTERAMREARIAARLRHPNAIAVHDVVAHDGRPCLVMEYLRSDSLGVVASLRGGLPPEEVAGIGAQVAAALAEAHAAGIVHRDVKPDNVLLTEDGTAKITDFGVSRAVGLGTVTATGILAGTPAYLAPEVAAGQEADARSDVFSLGATLYAAIEGEPPFGVDENPIALLHRVAAGRMAPPRRAGALTDLLGWLLRLDPGERPTMRTAHEALAAAVAGRPVVVPAARPATLLLVPPPRRVSRRTVTAGIAAVGLVAVGIVLGSLLSDGESTGATGSPTTRPATGASATSAPPVEGDRDCAARYEVVNSWPDGYQVRVVVRNGGDLPLTGWVVRWRLPDGHDVVNLWAGTVTRDGADLTVANAGWNATVPAGGSTEFGFTAGAPDPDRPVPALTCRGS
jgi:serine/threonine protein kinase